MNASETKPQLIFRLLDHKINSSDNYSPSDILEYEILSKNSNNLLISNSENAYKLKYSLIL